MAKNNVLAMSDIKGTAVQYLVAVWALNGLIFARILVIMMDYMRMEVLALQHKHLQAMLAVITM